MDRSLRRELSGQALVYEVGVATLISLMLTDMCKGCRHTKDAWNGRQGRQARRKSLVGGGPRCSDISLHRFQQAMGEALGASA